MEPLEPEQPDSTLPQGSQPLPSGEDLSSVPADELISAYLDGELQPQQQRLVEAQLAASPELRQLLEELQSVRKSLSLLPRLSLDADFAERVLRRAERQMLSDPPTSSETTDSSGPANNIVPFVAASSRQVEQPLDTPRRSLRPFLWAAVAIAAVVMIWVTNRGPQREQAEVAVLDQAGKGNGEKPARTSGTITAPTSGQLANKNSQVSQQPADKLGAPMQKDSLNENVFAKDDAGRLHGSGKAGNSPELDLSSDREGSSSYAGRSNSVVEALKQYSPQNELADSASKARGDFDGDVGSAGSPASGPSSGPGMGSGMGGGMAGSAMGDSFNGIGGNFNGPMTFADREDGKLARRSSGTSPVLVVKLSITPEAYRSKAFQTLLAKNDFVLENRDNNGLQSNGRGKKSGREAVDQSFSRSQSKDKRFDKADDASKVQSSPAEPDAPAPSNDKAVADADPKSAGSKATSEKAADGEIARSQPAVTAENEKSDAAPLKQKLALDKRGVSDRKLGEARRVPEMLLVEGTAEQVQRTLTELKSLPGQFQNIEVSTTLLNAGKAGLAGDERLNEPADGVSKALIQEEKLEQADVSGEIAPSRPKYADAKPVYESPVPPAAPSSGVQPTAEEASASDPRPAQDAPAAAAAPSVSPTKTKESVPKSKAAKSEPSGGRASSTAPEQKKRGFEERLSVKGNAGQKQRVLFVFSIAEPAIIGGEQRSGQNSATLTEPNAPKSAAPTSDPAVPAAPTP